MGGYVLRRALQAIPTLIVSTFCVFLILRVLPTFPTTIVDGSVFGGYWNWISHAVQGDLGTTRRGPVALLIATRIWPTLVLSLSAMVIMVTLSITLGTLAALNRGRRIDHIIGLYYTVVLAVPQFVFILLALVVFAIQLRWLPPGNFVDPLQDPLLALKHLILPAIMLSLDGSAELGRIVRHSLLDVIGADYIRTAAAKGVKQHWLVIRHAIPNAMVPVVTILGISFGRILGGSVITELLFNWSGIGYLLVEAINTRDYQVAQGVMLVYVTWFVFITFMTDVAYAVLDPRVRINGRVGQV